MEKLIKNAFSIYITKFGNQIIGLMLIPLISKKLTSDELSFYLLYLSLTGFSVVLFDYSSSIIGVKSVAKNIFSVRTFAKYNFAHKITLSAIFLSFGFVAYYVTRSWEYFLLVVACIPIGMKDVWYYQARLNMSKVVWFDILIRTLLLLFVFAIPSALFNIKVLLCAFIFFESISYLFYSYPLFSFIRYSDKKDFKKSVITNIKNGIHVFSARLSGAIYTNLTLPISLVFFSSEKIIVFGVCERILRIIVSLISPIITTVYPYLSSDDKDKKRIYNALKSFGIFLTVVSFLFIEKIAQIIFDIHIDIAIWQLVIFSIVPYFIVMGSVNGLLELNLRGGYKQNNAILQLSVLAYLVTFMFIGMFGDERFLFLCLLVPEFSFYAVSMMYIRKK